MTKYFFPFDSGPGANITEAQWTKMAQYWLATGIIEGLKVYADSTGLKVKIPAGKAWMKGHYFESDTMEELAINFLTSNSRIDRVILRLDWGANTIDFALLQGTPAVSPQPPAITQNYNRWEIPLAQITISSGAMTVAAENVTDERFIVSNVNGQQPDFIDATLLNGWLPHSTDYYPGQYMKDQMGFVHIRGRIKSGSSGTAAFILPSGYRPSKRIYGSTIGVFTETNKSRYEIYPSGEVYVFLGGSDNSALSLDDIPPFKAEQ